MSSRETCYGLMFKPASEQTNLTPEEQETSMWSVLRWGKSHFNVWPFSNMPSNYTVHGQYCTSFFFKWADFELQVFDTCKKGKPALYQVTNCKGPKVTGLIFHSKSFRSQCPSMVQILQMFKGITYPVYSHLADIFFVHTKRLKHKWHELGISLIDITPCCAIHASKYKPRLTLLHQ